VAFFISGDSTFNTKHARAGAEHNVSGWAWSDDENIGWISMNCENEIGSCATSNYGVHLDEITNIFSGYAWANPYDAVSGDNNIGWLSFEPSDLAGCPEAPCNARRVGNDILGWARFLNGEVGDGGVDETDSYTPIGNDYPAPPNPDSTPTGGDVINQYTCVDGENADYLDVWRTQEAGDPDETDEYGSWGSEYDAPPNNDTTPPDDVINAYACVNGLNGTYTDVERTQEAGDTDEDEIIGAWGSEYDEPPSNDTTVEDDVLTACTNGVDCCLDGEHGNIRLDVDQVSSGGGGPSEGWAPKAPAPISATSWEAVTIGDEVHVIRPGFHQKYNPATDSWTFVSSGPSGAVHGSANGGTAIELGNDGNIYAIGGWTFNVPGGDDFKRGVSKYNGSSWVQIADMPTPGRAYGFAVALDNKIYFGGGATDELGGGIPYVWPDQVDILNTDTGTWSSGPTIPLDYGYPAPTLNRTANDIAAFVVDGKIHIMGGNLAYSFDDHYRLEGGTWVQDITPPEHFGRPQPVEINGKIYMTQGTRGGPTEPETYANNVLIYDPSGGGSFSYGSEISDTARFNGAVGAVGCKLYSIGGDTGLAGGGVTNLNEEYTTDSCSTPATYRNRNVTCQSVPGVEQYRDRTVTCSSVPGQEMYHDREIECRSVPSDDDTSGWDGFVSLGGLADDGSSYGVTLVGNDFSGFAWGDLVTGWIDWENVVLDNALTLGVDKRGNGDGTITSTPDGITCGADCDEDYVQDTVVTLNPGLIGTSFLGGWSSNCTEIGGGQCQTTMDQSKTVVATIFDIEDDDTMCSDGVDNDESGTLDQNGGDLQPGDVDQNGIIEIDDVLACLNYKNDNWPTTPFAEIVVDTDGDGVIEESDCTTIQDWALDIEPPPAPVTVGPDPNCVGFILEVDVTFEEAKASRWFSIIKNFVKIALADHIVPGFITWGGDASSCGHELTCFLENVTDDIFVTATFGPDGGFVQSIIPAGAIVDCTQDGGDCIEENLTRGSDVQLRAEVCGNRIDDDLDGLVDEECPLTVACEIDKFEAIVGENVTWTATAGGGSGENYTFDWHGDAPLEAVGDENPTTVQYGSEGNKEGWVTVTNSGAPGPADSLLCTNPIGGTNIDVDPPPLGTQCDDQIDNEDPEDDPPPVGDGSQLVDEWDPGCHDDGEPDSDGDGIPDPESYRPEWDNEEDDPGCPEGGPANGCPACNDNIDNDPDGGDGFCDWDGCDLDGDGIDEPADPFCSNNPFRDSEHSDEDFTEI